MKSEVFIELFLSLGVACATEVKSNDSESCYLSCTVEDLAKQQKIYKAEVSDKKARVVNMTVSIRFQRTEGDACRNMPAIDVTTDSYFVWAASAKEPYLYAPPDFLHLAQVLSLHYRRMDVHVQCTLQKTELPPSKHNKTTPALSDSVMKTLMHGFLETTGGTLCSSFTGSPDNHDDLLLLSYKCCQLDEITSQITCEVVQSSDVDQWFQVLSSIWGFPSYVILYYLPAVICLFPVWPRITEDGTRCIALEDPSPAGFTTILVKLFVPENNDSLLNKARLIFLRAVLIPSMVICLPFVLFRIITFKEPPLYVSCVIFFIFSSIQAIIAAFSGPVRRSKCVICDVLFSEVVYHFTLRDAMRAHMSGHLSACAMLWRIFGTKSYFTMLNWLCSLRSFHSPARALLSFALMGLVIPLIAIIILPIFVICFSLCVIVSPLYLSPIASILLHEHYMIQVPKRLPISRVFKLLLAICIVASFSISVVMSVTSVLPYAFLILIDDADAVFPVLAFILPIVYYLYRCFASFSNKYQVLKIKLLLEIKNYLSTEGNGSEQHLLLYTKTGDSAIPKELFEKACRELHMSMLRDFSVALYPMVSLSLIAFSIFASIKVYGASTGISPLVQIVTIFLASSIPTIFQLFSFGKSDKKLKEMSDELRLKTVVATYARHAQRGQDGDGDDEGSDAGNGLLCRNGGTRYGSMSTTMAIAASIG